MNSGMFAVVFGAISGIFALVLFATLAADWIEDRLGTFASVCFFVLFGASGSKGNRFGCVLSVHIDNYRRNTTSWQQGNLAAGLAAAVLA